MNTLSPHHGKQRGIYHSVITLCHGGDVVCFDINADDGRVYSAEPGGEGQIADVGIPFCNEKLFTVNLRSTGGLARSFLPQAINSVAIQHNIAMHDVVCLQEAEINLKDLNVSYRKSCRLVLKRPRQLSAVSRS